MLRVRLNRQGGPLAGTLIHGIAFVILGGIMAAAGYDGHQDGKETESWPATDGRVLSSIVEQGTRTTNYDPEHPDWAVLETGADMRNVYQFGGGGAVFGTVGLGALGFAGVFVRRLHRGRI